MSADLPSSTTEDVADVEVLATRLMGWVRSDDPKTIGEGHLEGATPVLFRFRDGSGFGVAGYDRKVEPWNPFTDPRADLQVLERVREVWPVKAFTYNKRQRFLEALSYRADAYKCGDYARAALAVLREMEEGS